MATSDTKKIPSENRTDVNFQGVKLFIEGVQVPYISISISSVVGQMPKAMISLPPQVGLMEITRFYSPKVHIFFVDPIDGVEKVLFAGIIIGPSFDKSTRGSGSASISFQCEHRYYVMNEFLIDYTSPTSEGTNPQAATEQAVVKAPNFSSDFSVQSAMIGILNDDKLKGDKIEVSQDNVEGENKDKVSFAILPAILEKYKNRFVGVPGVLLNLWNQFKFTVFQNVDQNELSVELLIPLLEEGLKFFERLSGHYLLENLVEVDRIDPCPDTQNPASNNKPRIVPPNMRVFLRSAVQTEMSTKLMQTNLQFSNEVTSLIDVYVRALAGFDYEILYLNCPAEVPLIDNSNTKTVVVTPTANTAAVDVIVKPQIPFYYSPVCNILYPNMIEEIRVTQDDYNLPTRITLRNATIGFQNKGIDTFYRAPASIREAIARGTGTNTQIVDSPTDNAAIFGSETDISMANAILGTRRQAQDISAAGGKEETDVPRLNLGDTLGSPHNKVGEYEQGRGIKFESKLMPPWLQYYSHAQFVDAAGTDGWPAEGTVNYDAIVALSKGWEARYGANNANLNPWSKSSGLKAYQRLLIASVDYEYGLTIARARSGTVSTIFNPYIIPGYPMDILDSTPSHPSFHAYCTSVNHTITMGSISTSISFVGAMTYTELANYYMPPIHPWMQYTLGLAEIQTLLNNTQAKSIADAFYFDTLGVEAVSPTDVFDFATGNISPVKRLASGITPGSLDQSKGYTGTESNPNFSGIGNLSLVYRPIETKALVETRWGIKFIELLQQNYNSTTLKYDTSISSVGEAMELGQSQWLNYTPKFSDK